MPYYLLYHGPGGVEILRGSAYDNQEDAEDDLRDELIEGVKEGWAGEYILATSIKLYDGEKARITVEREEEEG